MRIDDYRESNSQEFDFDELVDDPEIRAVSYTHLTLPTNREV